ncbi:MAG TPA: SDR family NAD(P)-dependent oxidoreductase [Gammaproteobacteria bacterium]|nr:SDR family NAD(P)-dependent oxidoreductase [Gammaproteobacteria bacterium]
MDLSGKAVLVTGAGSGLGAATARALVAEGANVMLADVDAQGLTAIASELGEPARCRRTDVTDADQVQDAVTEACRSFGAIHGAIHCAGVVHGERVIDRDGNVHDLSAFARTVTVNLTGTFNVVRLAARAMADNDPDAEGERGVIVCTASVAAFDGQIGQAAYAASKAGVAGMTLPLARDLAGRGIRVVSIAPGIFETPMMTGMPEKVRASLGEQTPFPPRLGRPAEFAALALHIARNVMLNGEVIRLDGAIRMGPR